MKKASFRAKNLRNKNMPYNREEYNNGVFYTHYYIFLRLGGNDERKQISKRFN